MKTQIATIDLKHHSGLCLDYRRDAWMCSFGQLTGFSEFAENYLKRMAVRIQDTRWFYQHLWVNNRTVGQLEFRSFSDWEDTGYLHLFYLIPEFRGTGLAAELQAYLAGKLTDCGCQAMRLSVSRTNLRALRHYEKHGWHYHSPNPKTTGTLYYQKNLTDKL